MYDLFNNSHTLTFVFITSQQNIKRDLLKLRFIGHFDDLSNRQLSSNFMSHLQSFYPHVGTLSPEMKQTDGRHDIWTNCNSNSDVKEAF